MQGLSWSNLVSKQLSIACTQSRADQAAEVEQESSEGPQHVPTVDESDS